jgi:hypothetical protein
MGSLMQKIDVLVTTCILSVSIHALNATAAQNNIVVGANVYDEGVLSPAGQDAEIERMAHSGVKTAEAILAWRTTVPEEDRFWKVDANS